MLLNMFGENIAVAPYGSAGDFGLMTSAGYRNWIVRWPRSGDAQVQCDPVFLVDLRKTQGDDDHLEQGCKYLGPVRSCWIQRMLDGSYRSLVFPEPSRIGGLRLMDIVGEEFTTEQEALESLAEHLWRASPRLPEETVALLNRALN